MRVKSWTKEESHKHVCANPPTAGPLLLTSSRVVSQDAQSRPQASPGIPPPGPVNRSKTQLNCIFLSIRLQPPTSLPPGPASLLSQPLRSQCVGGSCPLPLATKPVSLLLSMSSDAAPCFTQWVTEAWLTGISQPPDFLISLLCIL